jgi:hypothetical protein
LEKLKRPDRISAHQAVNQAAHLIGIPYEFPLNGRQQVLLAVYALQDLAKSYGRLETQRDLLSWA